jgi:stage II sporulation protein B
MEQITVEMKGVRIVDKPKKGHTITIKLNGEHKKFKEEQKKSGPEPIIEPIPRVIKIDPSLSESEVIQETAAAQESIDESFDWIIPESSDDDVEVYKVVPPKSPKNSSSSHNIITSFSFKNKKKSNWPISQIVTTAVFAVLIGTTIGFFMLKLVITDSTENPSALPTVVEEEKGGEKVESGKSVSAALPELTTYMIQGGLFSSKEGAQETLNQVKTKGIPAQIIDMDGKQYLFFGVADSIEKAKAIGSQYKGTGVEDAFAKSLIIKEKSVSELTESEKSFIEAAQTIYQILSNASSEALASKTISEETAKALTGLEGQLKIDGIKNENVKSMKAELTSANEKVKAYQKSKKTKDLSEAQQHLLNFLAAYYSM